MHLFKINLRRCGSTVLLDYDFLNFSFKIIKLVSMYHIGRVIELFSGDDKNVLTVDNSSQAMLEMWDENLITVGIDSHLNRQIKKEDVVLVDYTATQTGPRMVVVKVLRGETAKRSWKQYKEHFEKMRAKGPAPKISKQSYVG